MRIIKNFILSLLLLKAFFASAQDPEAPVITHVSVDHLTQQVEINWLNSTPNVVGYIIYFEDISGLWIPLDTIMGIMNTSYLTINSNPQIKKETFSVVAFDALGNSSIRSESHSTVYLKFNYQNCDTNLLLFWNGYLNMFGMSGYQLRISKKDIQSGLVFSEQTISISDSDTSYSYPIDYSSEYSLWLETISPSGFLSKSNRLEITTTDIEIPQYSYINKVSVVGKNSIEVSIISDSDDLSHINIYKSNLENSFQYYLGKANLKQDEYNLIDNIVIPEKNIYYYQSKPVDICGKEYNLPKYLNLIDTSIAYNLKLKSISIHEENILVETGRYDNFLSDSHIELWKEVNNEKIFQKNVDPGTMYDVPIASDIGNVCVYLLSTENVLNSLNRKDTILSNKVCVSKKPILFIPQAFTPKNNDIKNDKWKVIINGTNAIQNFKLNIYNRYGQVVYETNSIDEGWDGKFNNIDSPDGVYIYTIKIKFAEDNELTENGTINLFR